MALIEKEVVPPKKELFSVRISPDVLRTLEQYCRFIESSLSYVVEASLTMTFTKDRSFQEWLNTNGTTGEKND